MTNNGTINAAAVNDLNSLWLKQDRQRCALRENTLPASKQALFNALALAGVASVTIEFDRYGDSGQIEGVLGTNAAGADVDLPHSTIELRTVRPGGSGIDSECLSLTDALERLAYDLLSDAHSGWENDDGAFGSFVFDVAARTIVLEHNARVTATETFHHSF